MSKFQKVFPQNTDFFFVFYLFKVITLSALLIGYELYNA